MNKVVVVFALALSSLLLGCPDKAGDGAKQSPSAPAAASPANAPGAASAKPAEPSGGGW
jgi:hypothetical protein